MSAITKRLNPISSGQQILNAMSTDGEDNSGFDIHPVKLVAAEIMLGLGLNLETMFSHLKVNLDLDSPVQIFVKDLHLPVGVGIADANIENDLTYEANFIKFFTLLETVGHDRGLFFVAYVLNCKDVAEGLVYKILWIAPPENELITSPSELRKYLNSLASK